MQLSSYSQIFESILLSYDNSLNFKVQLARLNNDENMSVQLFHYVLIYFS
jgi:hypothetical protein